MADEWMEADADALEPISPSVDPDAEDTPAATPAPEPAPEPAPAVAEASPPSAPAEPTAEQPPAAPATPASPQETKPQEQEAPAAPPAPAPTPEEVAAEQEKLISESTERLAKEVYNFDPKKDFGFGEDDDEELDPATARVLPQVAAKVHMTVLQSTMGAIATMMPQMMDAVNRRTSKAQEIETQFFGQYPELNKPEYRQDIERLATIHVAADPNAPLEKRFKDVAAQMYVLHRLTPPGYAPPASVPEGEGPPPVPPTGATPPAAPAPPRPRTQMEQLVEEFSEEEF